MGSKEPPALAIPTSTSSTGLNSSSGEEQREACKGLPTSGDYEGQSYCVLHYPAKNKLKEFKEAVRHKLEAEDFNFKGVWFPERTPNNLSRMHRIWEAELQPLPLFHLRRQQQIVDGFLTDFHLRLDL